MIHRGLEQYIDGKQSKSIGNFATAITRGFNYSIALAFWPAGLNVPARKSTVESRIRCAQLI